jgi:hypothetical protein
MPDSLLKDFFGKPLTTINRKRYRKPAGESLRDISAWMGEQWDRRWVKRAAVSALVVMLAASGAMAWVNLRPRAVPDMFEDDLADVLDYTLLSENFNKLPIDERMRLLKDMIARMKGMDSNDSALMAGFMAGITGKMRAQLQRNAEKLMVDLWDKYAQDYQKVKPDDRDGYLDKTFVDFTKMAEDIAGFKSNMDDNQRLDEAKKQAKRDEKMLKENAPKQMDPQRVAGFMGWMNDRSQKLTSAEQRGRMAGFSRDMTRRLRGQDVGTGKPKLPGAPEAPAVVSRRRRRASRRRRRRRSRNDSTPLITGWHCQAALGLTVVGVLLTVKPQSGLDSATLSTPRRTG